MYVFPHIFAEVMKLYMETHGVTEEQLAQIAVIEYGNAKYNPYAQMQKVQPTLEEVMRIEGINRYVVEGLPLKTYDCSQISDGYAAMILATEEGLKRLGVAKGDCVELAGYAQATDPLRKGVRDVLRPQGAFTAMHTAYEMAGVTAADVNVAEVHDAVAQYVRDEVGGASANDPAIPLPNTQDDAPAAIILPTGLPVTDLQAVAQGQEVTVSWRTNNEAQILGFNVLRKPAVGPVGQANEELIAAEHAGSNMGTVYRFSDAGLAPGTYTYMLQVIRLDGAIEEIVAQVVTVQP